jgi:iron complex transport system ATP-binding protein
MAAQRNQSVLTLSGGELQRTFLAQVFAQNPSLLLLDEPSNHLDLIYQKQVFMLIRDWLKTPGRAVLSVVHDLSLARAYGTRAVLLKDGQVIAQGSIPDVFGSQPLEKAYSMDVYAWMRKMFGQWTAAADASRGQGPRFNGEPFILLIRDKRTVSDPHPAFEAVHSQQSGA